jgi:hypothetical protein
MKLKQKKNKLKLILKFSKQKKQKFRKNMKKTKKLQKMRSKKMKLLIVNLLLNEKKKRFSKLKLIKIKEN